MLYQKSSSFRKEERQTTFDLCTRLRCHARKCGVVSVTPPLNGESTHSNKRCEYSGKTSYLRVQIIEPLSMKYVSNALSYEGSQVGSESRKNIEINDLSMILNLYTYGLLPHLQCFIST